ncbi:MAG: hypothetical protein AB7G15_11975 [Alphaproteobacteria bacterium]
MTKLEIAPPRDDHPPLKTNVFEAARAVTCTLAPLFPYLHAGAIVPTVALFWGRTHGDYGHFEHFNTVDEIVIVFGADGAVGRARTGLVRVNANTHMVGKFLPDPDNPENFSLISITQRQSDAEPQQEGVWFKCGKCQADLMRLDFAWEPVMTVAQEQALGAVAPLETVMRSAEAVERYNTNRTCPKCGHENQAFPLERWGWDRYAAQTEAVRKAQATLIAAVAPANAAE